MDEEPHGRVPQLDAAIAAVDIAIGEGQGLRHVDANSRTAQDSARRIDHALLHLAGDVLDIADRPFDQQSVVNRGNDRNIAINRITARQAQHFRAIGLHRKVGDRAGSGIVQDSHAPAVDCLQRAR